MKLGETVVSRRRTSLLGLSRNILETERDLREDQGSARMSAVRYHDCNSAKKTTEVENFEELAPLAYIWKTGKVRMEIFSFTMVVGTLYIVYQCTILATSTLDLGRIQISGIVLGGAEFCTYFVVFLWAKNLKRKAWTMVCLLVILFGAATVFALGFFDFPNKGLIIAFIVIFLCKVPVCVTYTFIFVYVSETFETNIRGTASGLIASIARFIGASSALVNLGITQYPMVQLVGPCALWGLVGLPLLMIYLKETHNQSTK